jgi:hypothetical protein
MSLTTTPGWWGISTWVQPYIGAVAAHAGLSAPRWASFAGMAYNVGAITGYIGLGFLADAFGRKRVPFAFFGMALLMTPVLFLWTHDISTLLLVSAVTGFFSLGQYTWMPTWLPELYPTRIRGTAIAFCFNVPRLLAWSGRRDVFARSQDIFGVSGVLPCDVAAGVARAADAGESVDRSSVRADAYCGAGCRLSRDGGQYREPWWLRVMARTRALCRTGNWRHVCAIEADRRLCAGDV